MDPRNPATMLLILMIAIAAYFADVGTGWLVFRRRSHPKVR